MSGYRQHSYDPNAYEQPGPPLRPFNWVQWTGVALQAIGLGLFLVYLAGKIGWLAPPVESLITGMPLMLVGVALINSRRAPAAQVGSEQLAKNRKTLLITVAICAAVIGAALVIEFTGA